MLNRENLHEETGEREFGASNSAVSFQLAQVRVGPDCVPVSLVIYIDGSFIKHEIPVKPIYGISVGAKPIFSPFPTFCFLFVFRLFFFRV